jgi:hypothetical protein
MQTMAKGRQRRRAGGESPTSDCLLICDDVLVSHGKGKHIIQGVIGAIVVRAFPARIGGYVAYVRLSNVYGGGQPVHLTFENAATGQELFRFETKLPKRSDPLGVYTMILKVPPFEVSESGRYIFSAKHGGVPFAQSPILIRSAREVNETSDDGPTTG